MRASASAAALALFTAGTCRTGEPSVAPTAAPSAVVVPSASATVAPTVAPSPTLALPLAWSTPDGLVWRGAALDEVGVVRGVAYARSGCSVARIDLANGARETPRAIPPRTAGACEARFLGDALVARTVDRSVLDPESLAPRFAVLAGTTERVELVGADGGRLLVAVDGRSLRALSLETGREVWSADQGADVAVWKSRVSSGTAAIATGSVVRGYDVATGKLRWERVALGEPHVRALSRDAAFVSTGTEVHVIDATNGTDEWRAQAPPIRGADSIRAAALGPDAAYAVTEAPDSG